MPVVSLWMSSLSACQSSSSFPVDLALLPTGLTHLHRSDSLLLVALTLVFPWICSPAPSLCGFHPSPWV